MSSSSFDYHLIGTHKHREPSPHARKLINTALFWFVQTRSNALRQASKAQQSMDNSQLNNKRIWICVHVIEYHSQAETDVFVFFVLFARKITKTHPAMKKRFSQEFNPELLAFEKKSEFLMRLRPHERKTAENFGVDVFIFIWRALIRSRKWSLILWNAWWVCFAQFASDFQMLFRTFRFSRRTERGRLRGAREQLFRTQLSDGYRETGGNYTGKRQLKTLQIFSEGA